MEDRYRIMVVDDERIVREAIADGIAWEDYGITLAAAAGNALEALDYLKDNEVDLILVDIQMPVMNGLELQKKVRSFRPDTDFIVLSGYAEFAWAQEAMRCGAKDYLLKPVNEESLLEAVQKCKKERESRKFMDSIREKLDPEDGASGSVQIYSYSHTVNEILRYIEEEIDNEDLSLKWISANRMFMTENYLSKTFRKEVGKKFSAYLLERRMTLAMQLLVKEQESSIQDIARRCGYGNNAQYFSSMFKKYTGYTPTEYRSYIRKTQKI
ncbi:MAG: response regulator [Lachnospiraceae bacterium]|nr:response regulator [Lachnospiraceae bacterium]